MLTGKEIYPHRPDLFGKQLWKCNNCGGYVGCHPNTDKPLGSIVAKEVKQLRIRIHNKIDPLWKNNRAKRKEVYKALSDWLGYTYHTGNINTSTDASRLLNYLDTVDLLSVIEENRK